jgi:hypothetical protein
MWAQAHRVEVKRRVGDQPGRGAAGDNGRVPVPRPDDGTRWRCQQCGNLTRFTVTRTTRTREYVHVDLAGEPRTEETEVLVDTVEHVTCRWCASVDTVEVVPRPDAGGAG